MKSQLVQIGSFENDEDERKAISKSATKHPKAHVFPYKGKFYFVPERKSTFFLIGKTQNTFFPVGKIHSVRKGKTHYFKNLKKFRRQSSADRHSRHW